MFIIILYVITIIGLIFSFSKSKEKTKKALIKALKSFGNLMPQLSGILVLIGIILSVMDRNLISSLIGENSGLFGFLISGIVGSITLIPGFVALPLIASLLKSGAGYSQMTMFLSTLMMVGIVTLPLEIQYFGKKITYKRNAICFLFSILIALIIGRLI